MSNESSKSIPARSRRWRWLGIAGGVVLIFGASYALYWAKVLRYPQGTDDAYVNGNVVQITPQISGTVVAIGADDTQFVKAGQPLVRLDQADAKVALDAGRGAVGARPCARCARCSRPPRSLQAAVERAAAPISPPRRATSRAGSSSASSGAVSGEELQHARDAVKAARRPPCSRPSSSSPPTARASIDTTLEDHPDVRNAAAAVRNAYLNLRAHRAAGAGVRVRRAAQCAARPACQPGQPR